MDDRTAQIKSKIQSSVMPKMLFIAFLAALLMVPVNMIENLIADRAETKATARADISSKWGGRQTFGGPILTIPYKTRRQTGADTTFGPMRYATFLPSELHIAGDIETETRNRGIYEALLYKTRLTVRGSMPYPDFAQWNIPPEDILWDKAYLSVGISDTRGIKKTLELRWDDTSYTFTPGAGRYALFDGAIGVQLALHPHQDSGAYDFFFELLAHGSDAIGFVPLGKQTSAHIRSDWPHPGFTGEFLPNEREIGAGGFIADWDVYYIERKYPQQWLDDEVAALRIMSSAFGVEFVMPVDEHQQSMRSVKYAILFIFLTFAVFFVFEILARLKIHPIQYFLIGFALSLFYLLLVSLSEHIGFTYSYAVAAVCCSGLIGAYSRSALTSAGRAGIITLILAALYAALYILLLLESFALLLGSMVLFAMLATMMLLTRNVDWYAVTMHKNNTSGENAADGPDMRS